MSDDIEKIVNKIREFDYAISSNFEVLTTIASCEGLGRKRPICLITSGIENNRTPDGRKSNAGRLVYDFREYLSDVLFSDIRDQFNDNYQKCIDHGLKLKTSGDLKNFTPDYVSINGLWRIGFWYIDKYFEPSDDWYDAQYMAMALKQAESENPYVPRTIKFNPRNQ